MVGCEAAIGVESRDASVTVAPLVSDKAKSGAFWPTLGACVEAGKCFPKEKVKRQNKASAATLSVVSIGPATFPRWRPGWANARRKPIARDTRAIAKKRKLAQGISRVLGYLAKMGT